MYKRQILDRPNPNGHYVDGPILEEKYKSFVGMHQIPIVHGMTIGEYATMILGEKRIENNSNLEIILSVTSTKEINIVNSIYAQLERDSNLTIHNISTGAGFSRSRMDIDLLGNGSEFSLDGIYFGEEKQIHDNRVFVNHLGKNTSSNLSLIHI